jgi:hypothetical protein
MSGGLREVAVYPEDPAAPAFVEFLWGEPLEDGSFRIVSAPYYAKGIAYGDVVQVGEEPELHFVRVLRPSGHSNLRVYLEPQVDAQKFLQRLEDIGCKVSPSEREQFYTVDVPEDVDITGVLDILSEGQDTGQCDWMDGSISQVHGAQLRAVMDSENLPDWVPPD